MIFNTRKYYNLSLYALSVAIVCGAFYISYRVRKEINKLDSMRERMAVCAKRSNESLKRIDANTRQTTKFYEDLDAKLDKMLSEVATREDVKKLGDVIDELCKYEERKAFERMNNEPQLPEIIFVPEETQDAAEDH